MTFDRLEQLARISIPAELQKMPVNVRDLENIRWVFMRKKLSMTGNQDAPVNKMFDIRIIPSLMEMPGIT